MKNKLLIAVLACLALSGCQQTQVEKDKDADKAHKVEPANTNPPGPGHTMNEQELNTNLAAEEQTAPLNTAAMDMQPAATTSTTSSTTTTAVKCADGDQKCLDDQKAAQSKAATDATMGSSTTNSTSTTVTTPDANQPAAPQQ